MIADGVVVETKDGIAENTPGRTAEAVTLETVAGNHVVLDFGKKRFALYAHFKPGSVRVKVGDRVKRGQVLGLVGNTGNSTEPHLHVHVSDAASPLGAEGVPWAIDTFEVQPAKETSFKKVTRELPLEDALVRFAP
ncbi:MAG: M23 family metallopeptidase [Labilithrix sp.]|nr:M23 family metallopeptidase [Labilithrix sp.]MCW5809736.1 M23 family metallopeptidase [Labilithrix sp.]